MLPLAASAFAAAELTTRLADHDARISFRGVRYSVDPVVLTGRRGQPVEVRVGIDQRLRIFHAGSLVGDHPLLAPGSPPCDDPRHAERRRRLRLRPPRERPRSGVAFDQRLPAVVLPEAPPVALRPLSAYEVSPCRPS